MKAILKFDLNDLDDQEEYALHTQAKAVYRALGDILTTLRTMEKHEEIPWGTYEDLLAELTEEERREQVKEQEFLEGKAQEKYDGDLFYYNWLGKKTSDSASGEPKKAHVPRRIRMFSDTGKSLISGHSMIGIIRYLIYEKLKADNVDLEIFS